MLSPFARRRAAAAAVVAAVLLLFVNAYLVFGPVGPGEARVVTIEPGESTRQIAATLERAGVIRSTLGFRLLARVRGADGRLRSGEYSLSPRMWAGAVLGKLLRGEIVLHPVTVPEGYTVAQIRRLLVEKGLADGGRLDEALRDPGPGFDFLPAERDRRVLVPLEGYLFPDTYHLPRGMPERSIVRAMLQRFSQVMTSEFAARAQVLKLTPHQVITLASIIEREARVPEELALVSAVYHNRLRIGMKLDADPTVAYVAGEAEGKPVPLVLFVHLAVDSPYNTYRNPGLPPGPIANPGEAAIRAALYPADVDYLYFVARGDGTHIFSRTIEEHERARRQVQGGR